MTWTSSDYDLLVSLARAQVPPIDPTDVAIVLYEESGLNPANPGPSAAAGVAGLNQMDTANLASLGLTRAQWLAMSVSQQLPWIFKFWQSLAKSFNGGKFPADAGELVGLNFLPGAYAAVGASANPDAPIAAKTGTYAWAWNDNPALQNSTGAITVNTLRTYLANVAAKAGATWTNAVTQIQAAVARAGGSSSPSSPLSPPTSAGGNVVAMLLLVGLVGAGVYFATRRV